MKKIYAITMLFILGFLTSFSLYAQQTVKGKVTAKEDGQPLGDGLHSVKYWEGELPTPPRMP